MNNAEVNKKDFQELIEKYLDGETTIEEVKFLVNYYESFQESHEWVEELGSEEIINSRMLINILEVLQDEEAKKDKIIPLYKRKIFQYGVAASLILFVAFNFIFNNKNNDGFVEDPIIVNNNIEIGTDKAILTLEDGLIVKLEKGHKYAATNLKSNGEELVYNKSDGSNKEVGYNVLTIPRGGEFFVKLSDGTQVWLNSESQLKYPVNFVEGVSREVELVYGEAYFDVSHSREHQGADFKVYHDQQEVQVLGTEFNIKAYKNETNVYTTLVEGKVAINYQGKTQNLIPSQQSNLNVSANTLAIAKVNVKIEVSWKDGVFTFKERSLKEIMASLSRWYDMDVVFENKSLEKVKFNGVLRKYQSIEEILSVIMSSSINNYEINDKMIVIR